MAVIERQQAQRPARLPVRLPREALGRQEGIGRGLMAKQLTEIFERSRNSFQRRHWIRASRHGARIAASAQAARKDKPVAIDSTRLAARASKWRPTRTRTSSLPPRAPPPTPGS